MARTQERTFKCLNGAEGDFETSRVLGAYCVYLLFEKHKRPYPSPRFSADLSYSRALPIEICLSRLTLGCVAFLRFGDNFKDVTWPLK